MQERFFEFGEVMALQVVSQFMEILADPVIKTENLSVFVCNPKGLRIRNFCENGGLFLFSFLRATLPVESYVTAS